MPRAVVWIFPKAAGVDLTAWLTDAIVEVCPGATVMQWSGRVVIEVDGDAPRSEAWGRVDGKEPNLLCPLDNCDFPARGVTGLAVHLARFHHLTGRGRENERIRAELLDRALTEARARSLLTASMTQARVTGADVDSGVVVTDGDESIVDVAHARLGRPRRPRLAPVERVRAHAAHSHGWAVDAEVWVSEKPVVLAHATLARGTAVSPPGWVQTLERELDLGPMVTEDEADDVEVSRRRQRPARRNPSPRTKNDAKKLRAKPVKVPEPVVSKRKFPEGPWVSTPIERRPFDPDAARAGGYRHSVVDL